MATRIRFGAKIGAVAVALAALAALGGMSTAAAKSSHPAGLTVLVVNDDGWNSAGIAAVHEALASEGHDVTTVAPDTNQSGAGASITTRLVSLTQRGPDVFSVDASPATAVLVGIDVLGREPDLVVSGINNGFNGGPLEIHSGTLGAASTALTRGIPSIAVATDPPPGDDAAIAAHFDGVAHRITELVVALQDTGQERLLPEGIGLKVGHPPIQTPRGWQLVEPSSSTPLAIGFTEVAPNMYAPSFMPTSDPVDGEIAAYRDGFITILPFGLDNGVDADGLRSTNAMLHRLERVG